MNDKLSLLRTLLAACVALIASLSWAAPGQPLPAAAWHPPAVGYVIGLYYLDPPARDPVAAARLLAADPRYGLKVVERPDNRARTDALVSAVFTRETKDFNPPSLQLLRYFGRGLSKAQAEALQKPAGALILGFAHPGAQSAAGLRRAEAFALELARRDHVILWDESTREAFTPEAWEASRLKSWEGGTPDVSKQVVIHAYDDGGHTRAITLGMDHFGLPDLVIDDSVWSLNRSLGSALNALAQRLVEAGRPDTQGFVDLDIAALRHAGVRQRLTDSILKGGRGTGRVRLLETKAEEGDPDNALAALSFEAYPGPDATARQSAFVTAVFGAQPEQVVYTKHDGDLLAVSARARARLPELQKAFLGGMAPGAYLMVKAPFSTASGRKEWMWVEVTEWKGERIRGVLRNEPELVTDLKPGQMVDVRQPEVFDYLLVHPDGRTEGNETSKLLERERH